MNKCDAFALYLEQMNNNSSELCVSVITIDKENALFLNSFNYFDEYKYDKYLISFHNNNYRFHTDYIKEIQSETFSNRKFRIICTENNYKHDDLAQYNKHETVCWAIEKDFIKAVIRSETEYTDKNIVRKYEQITNDYLKYRDKKLILLVTVYFKGAHSSPQTFVLSTNKERADISKYIASSITWLLMHDQGEQPSSKIAWHLSENSEMTVTETKTITAKPGLLPEVFKLNCQNQIDESYTTVEDASYYSCKDTGISCYRDALKVPSGLHYKFNGSSNIVDKNTTCLNHISIDIPKEDILEAYTETYHWQEDKLKNLSKFRRKDTYIGKYFYICVDSFWKTITIYIDFEKKKDIFSTPFSELNCYAIYVDSGKVITKESTEPMKLIKYPAPQRWITINYYHTDNEGNYYLDKNNRYKFASFSSENNTLSILSMDTEKEKAKTYINQAFLVNHEVVCAINYVENGIVKFKDHVEEITINMLTGEVERMFAFGNYSPKAEQLRKDPVYIRDDWGILHQYTPNLLGLLFV